MAQVTEVRLVDDIDGSEAHETVAFGLDGREYTIDLSVDHAKALRESFAEYVEAARSTSAPPARARRRSKSGESGGNPSALRQWAREHGHTVSDRGRVSEAIRKAYAEAHGQAS